MIGVSVSASRASVRRAQRMVRRWERNTLSAERRVLGRASKNVVTMSCAMLKGHKSKAGGPLAKLDKPWRRMLHPDKKMGGILANPERWHIGAISRGAREIDIARGLQPLLERWEHGGGNRAALLRQTVSSLRDTPAGRRTYYRVHARRPNWPSDPRALPSVPAQPERAIKERVDRYCNAHMDEWYQKIWQSYTRRG